MKGEKVLREVTGITGYVGLAREGNVIKVSKRRGVGKARWKRDPVFTRSREHSRDFGRAAGYGKLLRRALITLWVSGADGTMPGRMLKLLMEGLMLDTVNSRGERRLDEGSAGLLKGFELNKNYKLEDTLKARIVTSIEPDRGAAGVVIPSFVPREGLQCPEGASYYRLKVVGAVVDFEGRWYVCEEADGAVLPIDDVQTQPCCLQVSLGGDKGVLFLGMAVRFYSASGDWLNKGKYDAVCIVDVGGWVIG